MTDANGDKPAQSSEAGNIDESLLSLLVCPLTKQNLEFDRDNCELISRAANLAYPVRGGIAIMLPSEARSLDDDA